MLAGDGRSWAGVGSCVQLAEWVGDRSRAKASGQDQDLRWRHRGLTQGEPLMWAPAPHRASVALEEGQVAWGPPPECRLSPSLALTY